jgi:hypothetical protein
VSRNYKQHYTAYADIKISVFSGEHIPSSRYCLAIIVRKAFEALELGMAMVLHLGK